MKANVIKVFRDKNTNLIHEIGEEIEVAKKRFEEINSTSFGVFIVEVEEEEVEEVKKKETKNKTTKK